jgi:hypothetical protein
VQDLLSYGLFDWAITDDEATQALNILSALSDPQLQAAMARLDQKYKTRLLDNLPSSAKGTTGFTRVLVAMGPDAVLPYIDSLLSYGVFDWVVTDSEATEVYHIMMALPDGAQNTLIDKLGPRLRGRIASNLPRGALAGAPEKALLKKLFDRTPDAEVDTLRTLLGLRFHVGVGSTSWIFGPEFDATALRRMWPVLEGLPPAQVENNPNLRELLRDPQAQPQDAGGYYNSSNQVAIDYDPSRILNDNAPNTQAGDPLEHVNRFDEVVRHEVGHSVDARLGASDRYCIGNAAGGDWQKLGDRDAIAGLMVTASAGTINGLPAAQKAAVLDVLTYVINHRKPAEIDQRLADMDIWASLPAATQNAIKADNAVTQLRNCFSDQAPWYNMGGGGQPLNNRNFQEAYEKDWVSYDQRAWVRKVSPYQFRAPGEWFAEAYAAYYEPDPRGKGAKLQDRDAPTKTWFDTNVDNM